MGDVGVGVSRPPLPLATAGGTENHEDYWHFYV